jgi:hypothetical protein
MKQTWKSKRTVCRGTKSGKFATKGRCGAFKRTKVKKPSFGCLFK